MMRGLCIHYLNQGTVEEAIEDGRAADVQADLLESLPGMMFQITSAAGAVAVGARTFDDVANELTEQAYTSGKAEDFSGSDTKALLRITLDFIEGLGSGDDPLPALTMPWYLYGQQADGLNPGK